MTKPELEACIHAYGTDLYSFCKYLTGNVQEAEDLYQDTFLKAMELNDRIDMEKNPKSYLLAVAMRIWKNRKRKLAWRKRIADTRIFPAEKDFLVGGQKVQSPESQLVWDEERKEGILAVRQAVAKLPGRLKAVVLLYYMEGLSVAQAAEVAGIPQGTVKSRLYQARKRLLKELEDVLNEKRY